MHDPDIYVYSNELRYDRRFFAARSRKYWQTAFVCFLLLIVSWLSFVLFTFVDLTALLELRLDDADLPRQQRHLVVTSKWRLNETPRGGSATVDVVTASASASDKHDPWCFGVCPPEATEKLSQLDYVVLAVQTRLRNDTGVWTALNKGPRRQYVPLSPLPVPQMTFCDNNLQVVNASMAEFGDEPGLALRLRSGERLFFWPAVTSAGSEIDPDEYKDVYRRTLLRARCRRDSDPAAHLGAFYLSLLLPLVTVQPSCGHRLDMIHTWSHRDQYLTEHSWRSQETNRLCFKSTCRYCRRPICADSTDYIDGTIVQRPPIELDLIDNPWSVDCPLSGAETWRQVANFCEGHTLSDHPLFGTEDRHLLLRFIDASIFDYLIDNPIRSTLYFDPDRLDLGFVLMHSGKAFATPITGDMALLAPLFQCCLIDRRTVTTLRHLAKGRRLMENLLALMSSDKSFPFLDETHISAIERRISKVLAIVSLCVDQYGAKTVLK